MTAEIVYVILFSTVASLKLYADEVNSFRSFFFAFNIIERVQ